MRLIDAEKLFEEVGQIKPRNKEHYKTIGEFMNMITNSETINFRPKGEWIDREHCQVDEDAYDVAICPNCKAEITLEYSNDNFCPNCGCDCRGDK